MKRDESFTVRLNTSERQLIAAIAKFLDRTESDAVRVLVKERARELGFLSGATLKEERHVAHSMV